MDINLREVTSSAVLEEKKKLRKEFNYLDMIFYTLAALIGLDTIGAFAANGAQALTWLVISAITFLVPYALLTAELGSTFTQEGGMYVWCKMAGGRFFGAMGAMLYWVSNPLWLYASSEKLRNRYSLLSLRSRLQLCSLKAIPHIQHGSI